MNKITKILALAFMAVASMACNKIDDPQDNVPEPLEVNTNNISGKWELVEWNGAPMAEGTYVYMDIERGKTYTMYQNLDSFKNIPHVITGSYNLATDPELGAIIRGSRSLSRSAPWIIPWLISFLNGSFSHTYPRS